MTTLLLRLTGPMQSWGTQSRFRERDSGREPSKSGVIGLLCAALGRPRTKPVDDLAALRMGVRVDREGVVQLDYHTVGGGYPAKPPVDVALTRRYYLADASFLVGLEGDDVLIRQLDRALERPVWQLSLGRKAFPPSEPVRVMDGVVDTSLEASLRTWPLSDFPDPPPWRLVLDTAMDGDGDVRVDVPISFATRAFAPRYVHTDWVEVLA